MVRVVMLTIKGMIYKDVDHGKDVRAVHTPGSVVCLCCPVLQTLNPITRILVDHPRVGFAALGRGGCGSRPDITLSHWWTEVVCLGC
jgi:hypothetical protein